MNILKNNPLLSYFKSVKANIPNIVLLTVLLGLPLAALFAQCPNFTNLNAGGVTCQYGSTNNPFEHTGIASGRHTVITAQGTDPRTGGQLPLLPPGESRVVKLGNENVGAEAEAITYQFTVDGDYAILLLKFAVVLEDPGHTAIAQPRFVVRVLDNAGNLVETCAEYDVRASGNIPGFQTYTQGYRNVRWRPWTNVGLDLSRYIGQQIRLQFVTYDCDYNGHYGYAYFTASCVSNRLALSGCTGQQVTLTAPANFESYRWSNGATTPSTSYQLTGADTAVNCLITSATGCQFTLNAFLSNDPDLPTDDQTLYDTICEGESYSEHFFNLPVQNTPGNFTHVNSLYNPATCHGDVTLTLFLTVLQRFETVYDAVCQGQSYTRNGFHLSAADIQEELDLHPTENTVTFIRTIPTGQCDRVITLHLTVNPAFNMPQTITGNTDPCTGEPESYILVNGGSLSSMQWSVPAGVQIMGGQNSSEVQLLFADDAPVPTVLTLSGQNGCGSGTTTLSITPHRSYHLFFTDTMCTGSEYHEQGFNLPRQDSVGIYVFTDSYTTAAGCDSMRVLELTVVGTPTLTAIAEPELICNGQSTTLQALGENAGYVAGGTPPAIAIGDILCTDNSIVKPANWPVAGKTAMGVVFYVDNTKQHGWAVALKEFASVYWGPYSSNSQYSNSDDVPGIPNYTNARDAIGDENGMANTNAIRTKYGSSFGFCQAAYRCYYYNHSTGTYGSTHNGWYLPAAGQLRKLFGELPTLSATLTRLGPAAQQFAGGWYWSSSESSCNGAWGVYYYGPVNLYNKSLNYDHVYARPVRAF